MLNGQNIHGNLHLCGHELLFLHIDNTHEVGPTLLTLPPRLRLIDSIGSIVIVHSILCIFPGSKPGLLIPA